MTCTSLRSVSWSYNSNARSHPNGYDDLSQSQLFLPGSFAFIDVVTTGDPFSSFLSSKPSRRTVRETKLQRQGYYNNPATSQSELQSLLNGHRYGNLRKKNDENDFASFWSYDICSNLHGESSGSRLRQRRVEAEPLSNLENSSSGHRCSYAGSAANIRALHPDPEPPVTSQPQQRCLLIPPRPRLSSPLTPHPHALQPGPDLRRPLPNKRRRVEVPLLKKALVNSSNLPKVVSRSSPQPMFSKSKDKTQNQSGPVCAMGQDRRHHDGDAGILCSSSSSNSETEFETEVEPEISSNWVYIPLIPPLSNSLPGEDQWELILKGELHQ